MRKRCNISDIEKAAKRDCENRLLIAHDAKKRSALDQIEVSLYWHLWDNFSSSSSDARVVNLHDVFVLHALTT